MSRLSASASSIQATRQVIPFLKGINGKSFYKGGTFLFASTRDNGRNLDDYVLDLVTGNVT